MVDDGGNHLYLGSFVKIILGECQKIDSLIKKFKKNLGIFWFSRNIDDVFNYGILIYNNVTLS